MKTAAIADVGIHLATIEEARKLLEASPVDEYNYIYICVCHLAS